MPNWGIVDSINLRWNSWVILFLEMVQTIVDWATPTSVWDVQCFLGSPIFINNSLHIIP
jgi:hypothetical protein